VIDNASTDDTVAIVRCCCPSAELIRLSENRGFGAANNLAIQAAVARGAEFVLLLNQDAVLETTAAETLLHQAGAHERHGLLGAFQLTWTGDAVDRAFPVPSGFWDDLRAESVRELYETGFIPAVAVLIRRASLLDVGGFDPLFFMYHEDQDLCRRLARAGWGIGLVPAAVVRHWNGSSHAVRSWRWERNWALSDAILHLKWSPRTFPLAYVSLIKVWLLSGMPTPKRLTARAAAFAQAIGMAPRIWRHRNGTPFEFVTDRSPDVKTVG
jgi:GT2 family glycosyltransferase